MPKDNYWKKIEKLKDIYENENKDRDELIEERFLKSENRKTN